VDLDPGFTQIWQARYGVDMNLPGLARMSWIPMANYYWGSKFQLFDLFVTKALAFAPLGVLSSLPRPTGKLVMYIEPFSPGEPSHSSRRNSLL
jgi:hypothetical protein